jgi:hypothetical protein
MIAGVNGWQAVLAAFCLVARAATAADDLNGAAREMAAKTALLAGAGTPVSLAWHNRSSLGPAEFDQIRAAFEAALRQGGVRVADPGAALEVHLTISENSLQYLLVEEARKGDDRHVWMAAWKRGEAPLSGAIGISLDRRLIWEQDEPILDVAFPAGSMVLLAPSRITLFARRGDRWEARQSVAINRAKPMPRDPRGRLRANGSRFQAFLPGMACAGATDPELSLECHASDQPWVLESGSRALLLANFAAARNFFDGHVVTQSGAPKSVPPFYTAAAIEERGEPMWLVALVDGRVLAFDAELNPISGAPASLPAWGSDIAGIDARCGPPAQVLATRPGEGEPDAIQSWSVVDRSAVAVTPPVNFPGPVTALWASSGTGAVAVARDLATGRYAAYAVTVVCGS